jgi:Pregnancy-associated plasma protein-A
MKKQLALVAAGVLIFAACQKSSNSEEALAFETRAAGDTRQCASHEVLQAQLAADPGLQQRMNQIENFIQEYINNPSARLLADSVIEIPVVFNVLYKTNAQNVSAAQLQSQIDVLNEDFAAINADYNSTPALFQPVRSGNTKIIFVPDIVVRKKTNKSQWSTNNAMKLSSQGGINATSPTTKLNIWVCNMGGGILGYAQFPGGASATDGVVLDDNATGRVGTAAAPYGLGRTATHEVGHWLNLRHIWGDATCGNDFVNDTPVHNTSNGGCPSYPHLSTCAGNPVEMTMNYMDYTYDACMYMFTIGQKNRMRATFGSGGGRTTFAQP